MAPDLYKFQRLKVYQLALQFVDAVYALIHDLSSSEKFNLCSQLRRSATSVVLNIAEGSTGQSDQELHRFLAIALRSYLEAIACLDLITRRNYLEEVRINHVREQGHALFIKLVAFMNALKVS